MTKTADQLNVGDYFVGIMRGPDLAATHYKLREPFVRRRVIDGALINVVLIPITDGCGAIEIMKMFAALPLEHPHQLSDQWDFWVAGQRDKRSNIVSILDYTNRMKEA